MHEIDEIAIALSDNDGRGTARTAIFELGIADFALDARAISMEEGLVPVRLASEGAQRRSIDDRVDRAGIDPERDHARRLCIVCPLDEHFYVGQALVAIIAI